MHPLDLPETYKLAFAIIIGILYGVVFCKSGFADPVAVRNALRLRNGRLIKTVLLALGLGTVLFFFARRLGLVEVQVHRAYLWGSLFGGVFSGVGLVLCGLSATTAFSALGCGRLYALWSIGGMVLAIPFVNVITDFLSRTVYSWHRLGNPPEPKAFFDMSDPALYIAAGMCILLLLVHFTAGDKEE